MESSDIKSQLIDVVQLIDLTEQPIGLTKDQVGWSRVRSVASNCICCCHNNSITLVTTNDSYNLDKVPLEYVECAQTNPSLSHLALSNKHRISIVSLSKVPQSVSNETKIVNLSASEVIYWRWLDDSMLALLTNTALYTCCIHQQHIAHPAQSALKEKQQYLDIEKIYECHQHITTFCQVTDIQCDSTRNFFTISGLYSSKSLGKSCKQDDTQHSIEQTRLRPSFGSMPSRLSQLSTSLNTEGLRAAVLERFRSYASSSLSTNEQDLVCDQTLGMVQVYCKNRDRSQLIQAQAVTFARTADDSSPLIIIACKQDHRMRVHFTELADDENGQTSGRGGCVTSRFDYMMDRDFPVAIICTDFNDSSQQLAMVASKHGQLFVYSISSQTLLVNVRLTNDIISSCILDSKSGGLMAICRSGQVLLAKPNSSKLFQLLEGERPTKTPVDSTPDSDFDGLSSTKL